MTEVSGAVGAAVAGLALWDLTWREAAVLIALAISLLQYGGTAGVLSSMGRNGRLRHVHAEAVGAARGALAITVLVGPFVAVGAIDAFTSPERFAVYLHAAEVLAWAYFPLTVVSGVSVVIARATTWTIRSTINSMVFSTLVVLRPFVAFAGMAAAAIVIRDTTIVALGTAAVVAGVQSTRLTTRWWYARPVRLADLGKQ